MQRRAHLRTSLVFLGVLLLLTRCATNLDLMREAAQGHTATVQTFLAQGVDGNTIDRDGKTALMLAAFEGHTATVHVLLANGVQVNAKDREGATALMLAASRGHTDVVEALLAKGADVNLQNNTGQTALIFAVVGGHGTVAKALLAMGADHELKNQAGQTALTLAQARGREDVFKPNPQTKEPPTGPVVTPMVANAPAPKISLTEPGNRQRLGGLAIETSDMRLAGMVTEGAGPVKLFINGTLVPLDPQGRFNHTLRLASGDNVVVLSAIDTHGRNTEASFAVRNTGVRPSPPGLKPSFGRYHALVIGNNEYEHLPKLKTAVNDAQVVAATLRDTYSFQVTVLLNAPREDIVLALDKMRTTLTEDDNLLIYYAGHGTLDKEADRGYWLPVDAKPNTRSRWLSTSEITDTLKAMTSKHVLVVADSCYSGTLLRDAGEGISSGTDQERFFLRVAQKRSRTALTSGGLEPVQDDGGGDHHSVFSQAFISILQENRGILDGQQFSNQIKRLVVTNASQTPEYSDIRSAGHDGGDFLFVRKP